MRHLLTWFVVLAVASPALAEFTHTLEDPVNYPGLRAEVTFEVVNPTTLLLKYKNTSFGVPDGFDNSDQILSGISWDFGSDGFNGDVMIEGGIVVIGPFSQSLNFDTGSYPAGSNVSGEFGFGNMDGTGALTNFVSSNAAQATPFFGANLDGPRAIDGPQGGLVANPVLVPLGGLGVIQDEVWATLILSEAYTLAELEADIARHGIRAEFGSDAAFITPEPTTLAILGLGGAFLARRRRR